MHRETVNVDRFALFGVMGSIVLLIIVLAVIGAMLMNKRNRTSYAIVWKTQPKTKREEEHKRKRKEAVLIIEKNCIVNIDFDSFFLFITIIRSITQPTWMHSIVEFVALQSTQQTLFFIYLFFLKKEKTLFSIMLQSSLKTFDVTTVVVSVIGAVCSLLKWVD